jgi:hypothetical protein
MGRSLSDRVTALETNWPHLEAAVKLAAADIHAVKQTIDRVKYYMQVGVTLGLSMLISGRGPDYAAALGGFARGLLGLS